MSNPELVPLFDVETEGKKLEIDIDKNTNEIYFNKKKITTDIKLAEKDRRYAMMVAWSTVIIAASSVISEFIVPFVKCLLNW